MKRTHNYLLTCLMALVFQNPAYAQSDQNTHNKSVELNIGTEARLQPEDYKAGGIGHIPQEARQSDGTHLAWHVNVLSEDQMMNELVWLDVNNGEVIHHYSNVQHAKDNFVGRTYLQPAVV